MGKALLDLETSFYTPDQGLREAFARLGARAEPPEEADYLFFPQVGPDALEAIARASVGTLPHPEHAASLVLLESPESATRLCLSGPGVAGVREASVGLPEPFWRLRDARVAFPLGWDVFVLAGRGGVIGVPRSTRVEVIG